MSGLTKSQKIIIITLLLVVIGLLSFLIMNKNNTELVEKPSNDTKTIMIYIAGNDLESDNYIATGDLRVINPSNIDLNKVNIIMYTGGTKKWHNFVENDENGIYVLKSDGFTKIESYDQANMGSATTLSSFLNYAYENYPADSYNMIFYGHGSGIIGSTLDEITDDNLSLADFAQAFNNSPFKDKKIDTVIFRSCLNGTLEFATLFKNYAKYMVASEEVSLGINYISVLNFINDVKSTDDGFEFGKKFVDGYQDFLRKISLGNTQAATYSIVDLSKVDAIVNELNSFISKIDLNTNYIGIADVRNNQFQYGVDYLEYDTIDLYTMVKNVSQVTKIDGSKVLNSIKSAVVYNKTNEESSNGLSIYFPYNGSKEIRDYHLNNIYVNISSLKDYNKFISDFNQMKDSQKSYAFSFSKNNMSASSSNKEATLKLTSEQENVYSSAKFLVFRRVKDHPDYYTPLLSSDNVTLKDGVLHSNIGNNLIKWYDVDDGIDKAEYITVIESVNGNIKSRNVVGLLSGKYETDEILNQVSMEISDENGSLVFKNAKLKSRNGRVNGIYLDVNSADYITILTGRYKILDKDGKYTSDWESAPAIIGNEIQPEKAKLIYSGLNDDEEYYCLFSIKDVNGNMYYSDMIKVGN